MKYIKTYEVLHYNDIDHNKIYMFSYPYVFDIVGKINLIVDMKGDRGWEIRGYITKTNDTAYPLNSKRSHNFSLWDWKFIFEATPEEIEQYEILDNANKYNL